MTDTPNAGFSLHERFHLGPLAGRVTGAGLGVGVLLLAVAATWAVLGGAEVRDRFFFGWLVNACYDLSLSLGALVFVMVQHVTRAGWSVVLRRLAEGLMLNVVLMLVVFLPLLAGLQTLYPWSVPDVMAHDPLLAAKAAYLNVPFFLVRGAVYFALWIGLAWLLFSWSRRQDDDGAVRWTLRLERLSAPGLIVVGLTLTFAAFDWLMTLDPHWYSTIFGVYYFAGAMLGALAALVVLAVLLQHSGRLVDAVTPEHYHDLGKLLFGFVIFWAYIAFSQYMLIWYANIPEETLWYYHRQAGATFGPWSVVGLVLLVGHFVLPFVVLLSRGLKRRPAALCGVALWLLVMHWVDLYWLVLPALAHEHAMVHPLDLLLAAGMGALYCAGVAWWLRRSPLLPQQDPRLVESLAFENA